MKINYKFIWVFILILMGHQSCLFFETCGHIDPYFRITGLDIYDLRFIGSDTITWTSIKSNDKTSWDEYYMRVSFQRDYYSNIGHTIGQSAFALSCEEHGYNGAKEGVDTLFLITLNNYNESHLANDTINDIILLNDRSYRKIDFHYAFSLEEYISINNPTIRDSEFEIKISEAPSVTNEVQQFRLVYILSNGEMFETVSSPVLLK